MYGGSVAGGTGRVEHGTAAMGHVEDLNGLDRASTVHTAHSARSGSRSTHSSRRSTKPRGGSSPKKSVRDPRVSAKARMSFAFGITLLVALVICESPWLRWSHQSFS
jgi:hypothetical protein